MSSRPLLAALRRLLPVALLAALLLLLARRVTDEAFLAALAGGPYAVMSAFAFLEVLLILLTDVLATRIGLAAVGIVRGPRELFWVRGATYLLGLVHSTLGHGGLGVHLARTGVAPSRAAGATGFLVLVSLLAQLAVALAVLPFALTEAPGRLLLLLLAAGAAGVAVYAAVVAGRPAWLGRWPVSRVLAEAGLRGHLAATAARLPQVAVLVLVNWVAFRLWGLPVPLAAALAWMPLVLLVVSLPLTPAALGTTQALQVLFFAAYAPGTAAAEREAALLAFSLVHHGLYLAAQTAVGVACLARWRRLAGIPPPPPQGLGAEAAGSMIDGTASIDHHRLATETTRDEPRNHG